MFLVTYFIRKIPNRIIFPVEFRSRDYLWKIVKNVYFVYQTLISEQGYVWSCLKVENVPVETLLRGLSWSLSLLWRNTTDVPKEPNTAVSVYPYSFADKKNKNRKFCFLILVSIDVHMFLMSYQHFIPDNNESCW